MSNRYCLSLYLYLTHRVEDVLPLLTSFLTHSMICCQLRVRVRQQHHLTSRDFVFIHNSSLSSYILQSTWPNSTSYAKWDLQNPFNESHLDLCSSRPHLQSWQVRLSFWYWKLGGRVQKTTLYHPPDWGNRHSVRVHLLKTQQIEVVFSFVFVILYDYKCFTPTMASFGRPPLILVTNIGNWTKHLDLQWCPGYWLGITFSCSFE